MIGLKNNLKKRQDENNPIRVCLVGAGMMGKGFVSQVTRVDGMQTSVVCSNKIEDCYKALEFAGIKKEDIIHAKNTKDIDKALEQGKYAVTDDWQIAIKSGLVDVVLDATGVPETGASIALNSINEGKHIVMLNVEADVVVGPFLNKLAKEKGVVYTGSAGDEPGAALELYDFATIAGFEVLAIGKGKNNPLNYYITPDMVEEEAIRKGLKPLRLASFIDGTNTMVELAAMANATGFVPDIRGGHGVTAKVEDMPKIYSLKENGGILDKYGIVDFTHGIAPGVYAIITTDLPVVHKEMQFLKMGEGPNYILYRPYHLTSLETPISIAKAVILNEPSIVPKSNHPYAEVITRAKKDLKKGEHLDGIGEYTVFGSIDSYEIAKKENLVPIGLINKKATVTRDIKKGEYLTYEDVNLDAESTLYKLRKLQDNDN